MPKSYCCPAMERAIQDEYIEQPISYTDDKQVIYLTPVLISHREREPDENMPVFVLNFCPWCGADLKE